jgi:hypothetical protein
MTDIQTDAKDTVGWVKTHVMLAACLGCFILGAVCGHFIHF